jgi:hypothetical protein
MRIKTAIFIAAFLSLLPCIQSEAQDSLMFKVERLSLNSGPFSEISPVITSDGIIFCSDRRTSGITYRTSFDNRRLYNIYIAERKDSSDWRKPVMLKSERSDLFNNGPLCIAPDGITVYFTSEIETGVSTKSRKFMNRSGIFTGQLSGNEILSIQPLKFNNPEFNLGQPSVSSDGRYLYFSSDMPGGQGGSDLFYCESVNGVWSDPVNLGPDVNSSANENYPFIHPSGKLYFTSNRPGGMGGLDVYFSIKNGGNWETPVRLSEPVNSSSDDFALVALPDLQKGYFSSNRARNDDIYEFVTTIIRKSSCNVLEENNYCYEFTEENAVRYDTIPFSYEWKFGDGNTADGKIVEHCFPGPGTYIVQLDVTNLVTKEVTLNMKSDVLVIEDIEQPYISCPDFADAGQAIYFSADSTNLPGWDIGQYYWNFGDETIAVGKNVDKTYLRPGTYNIQLIVSTRSGKDGTIREACISKDILIKQQP